MPPLPTEIVAFLRAHHVLSLAVCSDDMPWAANVFFDFDEATASFAFLGHMETLHGHMLQANHNVAGTVAGQPYVVEDITGMQFRGQVRLVGDDVERGALLERYLARFPWARNRPAPLWQIDLRYLKLTDNRISFGHKLVWERDPDRAGPVQL